MANVENARTLLAAVKEHQEAFDMNYWLLVGPLPEENVRNHQPLTIELENLSEGLSACGTTLCLAGFAHFLSGRKVEVSPGYWGSLYQGFNLRNEDGEYFNMTVSIPESGQDYLDISDTLASVLFQATNNTAFDMLTDLAAGVPEEYVLQAWWNGAFDPSTAWDDFVESTRI
jgi:hypothetical protein